MTPRQADAIIGIFGVVLMIIGATWIWSWPGAILVVGFWFVIGTFFNLLEDKIETIARLKHFR